MVSHTCCFLLFSSRSSGPVFAELRLVGIDLVSTNKPLLKSPVLSDLVKTIVPLLLSRPNGERSENAALPPTIYADIDGSLVEMTAQGYEVYKSLRGRLASKAGNHDLNVGTASSQRVRTAQVRL